MVLGCTTCHICTVLGIHRRRSDLSNSFISIPIIFFSKTKPHSWQISVMMRDLYFSSDYFLVYTFQVAQPYPEHLSIPYCLHLSAAGAHFVSNFVFWGSYLEFAASKGGVKGQQHVHRSNKYLPALPLSFHPLNSLIVYTTV